MNIRTWQVFFQVQFSKYLTNSIQITKIKNKYSKSHVYYLTLKKISMVEWMFLFLHAVSLHFVFCRSRSVALVDLIVTTG